MKCLFVSDLHGKEQKYSKLFEIVSEEQPDAVFIGGDLLPNDFHLHLPMEEYMKKIFFKPIKKIRTSSKKGPRFFTILGNDDPRIYEQYFLKAEQDKLIDYINQKTVHFNTLHVTGYSFVPPTPFRLKDWEKYDVSQFVDIGGISPEEGTRTVPVSIEEIKSSTIAADLDFLSTKAPSNKTIFLFHSPPYNSNLDHADIDGKMVDHAPMDMHIGSIAIQRFIQDKQPFLTLHGHVHESARLSGSWKQKQGKTFSFSAAHDGPELVLIRFDTQKLYQATRELISVS